MQTLLATCRAIYHAALWYLCHVVCWNFPFDYSFFLDRISLHSLDWPGSLSKPGWPQTSSCLRFRRARLKVFSISQGFPFLSSNTGQSLGMLCSTLWTSFSLFLKLLPTFAMWSLSSTTDTLAFSDTNFQISKAYIFLFFNFLLVEDKIYSMSALLVFLSISNKIFPEVDAKLFDKHSLCISTQILSFQNVSVSAMLPLQTYCCVQLFKHEF